MWYWSMRHSGYLSFSPRTAATSLSACLRKKTRVQPDGPHAVASASDPHRKRRSKRLLPIRHSWFAWRWRVRFRITLPRLRGTVLKTILLRRALTPRNRPMAPWRGHTPLRTLCHKGSAVDAVDGAHRGNLHEPLFRQVTALPTNNEPPRAAAGHEVRGGFLGRRGERGHHRTGRSFTCERFQAKVTELRANIASQGGIMRVAGRRLLRGRVFRQGGFQGTQCRRREGVTRSPRGQGRRQVEVARHARPLEVAELVRVREHQGRPGEGAE